jgi:hypothetical protein
MTKRSLITIAIASAGTIAALVGLSLLFALTTVPPLHVEMGWIVTAVGCGLMAWRLRSNVWLTLLACAVFIPFVRFAAMTIAYGIKESGVLWR